VGKSHYKKCLSHCHQILRTLRVILADGSLPGPSETYTILDALNIGAGSFSNVANGERLFLDFSAGSFIVNYGAGSPFDPSQVVLSSFLRSADADFDDDRDVENDDLTVWQAAFGYDRSG